MKAAVCVATEHRFLRRLGNAYFFSVEPGEAEVMMSGHQVLTYFSLFRFEEKDAILTESNRFAYLSFLAQ